MNKIEIANNVLSDFSTGQLSIVNGRVLVKWTVNKKEYQRQWMCRGQDFYPVWSRLWCGGGTSCTALSQLVRWVKDKPVLPLSTWEYWATPQCNLLRLGAVNILREGGYPQQVKCVLCNQIIKSGLDWWHLDKVSGPCCGWKSGCRQNPENIESPKNIKKATEEANRIAETWPEWRKNILLQALIPSKSAILQKTIKEATEQVKSWPKCYQNILMQSMNPTVSVPRKPICNK